MWENVVLGSTALSTVLSKIALYVLQISLPEVMYKDDRINSTVMCGN
jgi:hypothetical protein